ncbi:hypothetical protein L6R29_19510 [Myxococcota bacterium]|nr:hypothetical protein [Myxococcota bacterium]
MFEFLKNLSAIFQSKPSLSDLQTLQSAARKINDWLASILPISPEIVSQMSYADAIRYFVEDKPNDSSIVKGAMLLQEHPQGKLFVQVFLNGDNELVCKSDGKPYGRRLIVRSLDSELKETFGNEELVVVE